MQFEFMGYRKLICRSSVVFAVLLAGSFAHGELTHGPMLGRPGPHSMSIWVRTNKPAEVRVRYGLDAGMLHEVSQVVRTVLDRDNTGVITLEDLQPGHRYFYAVDTVPPTGARVGSFRTLPHPDDFRNKEYNPEGLFNFSFEFGCGNNQRHADALNVPLRLYETMNHEIADEISFAILNGDWVYEEKRDYPVADWLKQTGTAVEDTPDILRLCPSISGAWENYKLYWDRAPALRAWHAAVPSFFTVDDHELVNDIYGCGTAGFRNRRAVFRDPGIRAWFDYLAWANPQEHDRPAHIARAQLRKGSDILHDSSTDFTKLPLGEMANLHVHFGTQVAGVKKPEPDPKIGDPNYGVYEIREVLGPHRLRIFPEALETRESVYSIGRRTYGSFRMANCEFFLLDTRTDRDLHDVNTPEDPDRSMLGAAQLEWLMSSMRASDAEFFFVVSSVNMMVPHVGSGAIGLDNNRAAAKDDAWTVFVHEREKLIRFWDEEVKRPVFVLTGDLHTSFAIKVTDSIWEFASGPHNSPNHRSVADAGGLPIQGRYQYGRRPCEVRWTTYVLDDIPREHRRFPTYCVVQVNNVFDNPPEQGTHRWVAYPKPHVMFQFYDGLTGGLKYVETIFAE